MEKLLNEPKTAGLRFDSQQDTLDFQAKIIEDSKDWLAYNDRDFVERYKRNEVEIVIPCCIRNDDGAEPDHYHLIVSTVPFMGIGHRERSTESLNRSASPPQDSLHGRDEFMFIPITQFVQCPQEVIASSVRLEPTKQRLNLFREVSGTPDRTPHVAYIVSKRKCTIPGIGFTSSDSDGVPGIIQSTSQINNDVTGDVAERFWEGLNKFYLVNLPIRCLRIGFDNFCVWVETMEFPDSPVEIGKEVFLSPCDLAPRTVEGVRHGSDCINSKPPYALLRRIPKAQLSPLHPIVCQ